MTAYTFDALKRNYPEERFNIIEVENQLEQEEPENKKQLFVIDDFNINIHLGKKSVLWVEKVEIEY